MTSNVRKMCDIVFDVSALVLRVFQWPIARRSVGILKIENNSKRRATPACISNYAENYVMHIFCAHFDVKQFFHSQLNQRALP